MQKTHLSFIGVLTLAVAFLFGGCDKPSLDVSTKEISVGCDGQTIQVEVSSNSSWSASSSVSWLTVKPAFGNGAGQLNITVLPNSGGAREGKIMLFQKDQSAPDVAITVRQSAIGEHTLSLSPMVVVLENGNLEAQIDIMASVHGWTFDIIEGGEWLEVSKGDSKLSIQADPLRIPYRTGTIKVISGKESRLVYVLQGDFKTIESSVINAGYYGSLDDADYTTGLISVTGEKYASPYVGQDYQDDIMVQINFRPTMAFHDFRLEEGKYPVTAKNDGLSKFCTPGFFDDQMGVYGSCWLLRWYYMDQDMGYNALHIFQEGDVFIAKTGDATCVYILATGIDQMQQSKTFAMKIEGEVKYVDATSPSASQKIKRMGDSWLSTSN